MEPYQIALIVLAIITAAVILGMLIRNSDVKRFTQPPYPIVDDFAAEMRKTLIAHEGKYFLNHWPETPLRREELIEKMYQHAINVKKFTDVGMAFHTGTNLDVDPTTNTPHMESGKACARRHAVHLANYAMMLWEQNQEAEYDDEI